MALRRLVPAAACLCIAVGQGAAEPPCRPLDVDVARTAPPPSVYVQFCAREPEACALSGAAMLDWSDTVGALLDATQRAVNADITFVPDWDCLGVEEHWSFPAGGYGDCEDYALEKRRRLVVAGLPPAALTMAIAQHRTQHFLHAVLLAETSAGTFVLDNLSDSVTCWTQAPYTWLLRETSEVGVWQRFARP